MRELYRMIIAKQASDWDQTAMIVTTIENIVRGKDSRVVKMHERNPYREEPRPSRGEVMRKLRAIADGNR